MEILLANPLYLPYYGGTEKVIYQIGRRLSHKYDISILTSQMDNTHALDEEDGMIIHRLPAKVLYNTHPLPPPIPIIPSMNSWMRKNIKHYSIVHIHNRYFFNPLFGDAVKNGHKKLCLTIHNARTEGIDLATDFVGSVWDDVVAKRLMKKCDGIAGVSTSALESAIPKDYRGIKKTIYNGVDEKVFRPGKSTKWKDELGIDDKMVLTNARLIVQKGIRYLIEAMKEVDGELVVFGRGPLQKQLEKRAAQNEITIHFVSQKLTDEELADLYRSADVFAMPSLYDPCPLALLEAMGTGLPCVVTNVGGLKELIRDKTDGFVVNVRDPGALASRINLVLGNEDLSKEMSKSIRKRVLDGFTWDRVASEYDKFYEELLEKKKN
jgi:glycosyltransferase involved in cell wall biosynthesis